MSTGPYKERDNQMKEKTPAELKNVYILATTNVK